MIDITLLAASWSGSSAPYSYIINNEDINSDDICDILFNPNTTELINALSSYRIAGYKQESGKLTIYAWGEKPSMDLSATLVVRGGI